MYLSVTLGDKLKVNRIRNKEKNPKLKKDSSKSTAEILLPTHIFQDRDVSVLEAISEYMKDSMGLSYHEIAQMLSRDDRTIWTCYNRAKIKRKK